MTGAHRWHPASGRLSLGLALATMLGACGATPASPMTEPTVTPGPTPSAPTASTATPSAQSSLPSAMDGGVTVLDESLLAILPASVAGAAVKAEPQSFTEALADPAFVSSVESAAFAVVVDGGDLASGVVARLRPDRFSDAFFRDWRDTYNEGACAQAGGVVGNAEAQLGGRTTYIASCTGDLRVYHAYLESRGVLVSLFSVGDRRFGEQLMAGLRP